MLYTTPCIFSATIRITALALVALLILVAVVPLAYPYHIDPINCISSRIIIIKINLIVPTKKALINAEPELNKRTAPAEPPLSPRPQNFHISFILFLLSLYFSVSLSASFLPANSIPMISQLNRFVNNGAGLEKTLRLIQSSAQVASVFTVNSTAVRLTTAKLQLALCE